MRPFAIARANVIRMLRDRSNIFFVFIFPLALVVLIGAQFGSSFAPRLGVYDADGGRTAATIVGMLDDGLDLAFFEDEESLTLAVERGQVAAGLSIPAETESRLRNGDQVELGFVATSDGAGPQVQALVTGTVARATESVGVAQFVSQQGLGDFETGLRLAEQVGPAIGTLDVTARTTGESLFPNLGQFDLGASSQLLLFMFLTGMAGSAVLIQTRQLGLSTRMLSTPTPVRQIVLGEALGRFGVVVVQGLYIMIATWLIFRVNWGDPIGAIAILLVFAAVSAGAATLVGAVLSNDAQAAGVGLIGALGLAALGGSMLPLELFSPTLRAVSRVTPHAWANEAFAELVRRNGTVIDILPQLGVLVAMAVVLLALAAWRLRVAITRP